MDANANANIEKVLQRLENVTGRLESLHGNFQSQNITLQKSTISNEDETVQIEENPISKFKSIIDTEIKKVVEITNILGKTNTLWPEENRNEVIKSVEIFKKGFEEHIRAIEALMQCKQPIGTELQSLVQPSVDQIIQANAQVEGKRSNVFNHQKTISEFMQCLTWIALTPDSVRPSNHIEQCWQSAEFYSNKILKEFRSRDKNQIDWVDALKEVSNKFKAFLVKYHMKQVNWKKDGITVSEFLGKEPPKEVPEPPAPKPKPQKAPVKPPKSENVWQRDAQPTDSEKDSEALAETKKGLKKTENVTTTASKITTTGFAMPKLKHVGGGPSAIKGEGKTELQMGRKWVIENHVNNKEIKIEETTLKQSVYIYKCEQSTIQIKGKVSAISIDNSKKTALVFEDVVSSVEIINSNKIDVQCTGNVSTIVIDKCDGCKVYVPEKCLNSLNVTTAKASSNNIVVVKENPEEDSLEHPIPEQFVTKFVDGKFITEAVKHAAGG